MLERIEHAFRHPRSLLPGAPHGVINDARAWVDNQRASLPIDIRRGAAAACYPFNRESLVALSEARDADTGGALRIDRLMPVPASNLFFLRGARLIGDEGAVISCDNRVFAEFTYVDEAGGIRPHAIFRRRRFATPKPLPGWYATLCYPSATAYFHWLVECLPRLALLDPYLDAIDGFFVPERMEPALIQSLEAFGISESRLIRQTNASHFAPEHLLVPAYCAGRNVPAWVSEFLRTRVLPNTRPTKRRRIYVSRADAGKRRVVNERELLPVLDRHEIELCRPSELTFAEQAALFDAADLVVGPHGAGLTNALFCRPGAKMLELLPAASVTPGPFHSVSAAAKMSYWCSAGERADTTNAPDVHADFIVQPARLDAALRRASG